MRIKRENNVMIMSENLVCDNYINMNHVDKGFEKVSDNEYKCIACNTVMITKEPILVLDDKGKLKMQIAVVIK